MKTKLLQVYLNVLKFFSYYTLLALILMSLGFIIALCTRTFTFNSNVILVTPKEVQADQTKTLLSTHEQHPSISNGSLSIPKNTSYSVRSSEFRGVLSDEELMRKAAMVREMEKTGGSNQVPKIAFMFMTQGSLPLAPFWERFFKGHEGFYSIYVHSDSSAYKYSRKRETGVFRGRLIPSKEVRWAEFSMVEAELRLLANALLDSSNERFILLSESCIPLFNFPTIYSYLMNSTQTHIEAYDLKGPAGRGRYRGGLWPNITVEQWRKGSQWFEMDRDLAIKVISDRNYFNLSKRDCEPSWSKCCADEHYFPTWVNVYQGSKNSNRSLTWVDWSAGQAHPAQYRSNDITFQLLKRLRSNHTCLYNGVKTNICYLFARKFAPSTLGRLLRLAPKLMKF